MTAHNNIIIVTGAAGFIGSCTVQYLNNCGYTNLLLVDDFSRTDKTANWSNKKYVATLERTALQGWLKNNTTPIAAIIHLGARTDTTEFDYSIHETLNVAYSKMLWTYATENNIPLIYASSAATYGSGTLGYDDNHSLPYLLQPLNPYGISKNEFDKWALAQTQQPPCWTGLKFFNVYGPNEAHKGRMASVIWHSYLQIQANGEVKLFQSHKEGFKDGEQLRDFVYVKDVIKIIYWQLQKMLSAHWPAANNGLYNLGTGKARSFYDLAKATFTAMEKPTNIVFIPMPEDIRDKYQYFTEANMQKLRKAGYSDGFYTLEEGVTDYVQHYLLPQKLY